MAITGYLLIDDIPGESQRADHEDEIDIVGVEWKIAQAASAQIGKGRSRSRAQVGAVKLTKTKDAASAYLALACMQGKSFPSMTLAVRKDSGDAHLDYLIITMEHATISSFRMAGGANLGKDSYVEDADADSFSDGATDTILEEIGVVFENVTYKYTVQADDHSAGDEHEITFDIAAGV